jgi:hypothetical protein
MYDSGAWSREIAKLRLDLASLRGAKQPRRCHSGAMRPRLRHSGAMRSIEPGISRFRVWSFGPSRNDGAELLRGACHRACIRTPRRLREAPQTPSFRGDAKHRTRNLEIPGLTLTRHPGMTASGLLGACHRARRRRDPVAEYDDSLWSSAAIQVRHVIAKREADEAIHTPSFRGDAKHRTRNLEIPRCAIAHLRSGPADHPGMTESELLRGA